MRDRYRTLETHPSAVAELAGSLSPDDPATACHIVLTTYQTFHIQTLSFEEVVVPGSKEKGQEVRKKSIDKDDQDSDVDDNKDQELSEEQLRRLKSLLPDVFGIIIADKSYKLKSIRTRTHQAVLLALPTNIILVSATPTINRSADLYSMLSLIWQHLQSDLIEGANFDYNEPPRATLEQFKEALEDFDILTTVNFVDIQHYLMFLYPGTFQSIANKERQLSTSVAAQTLLLILSLIQLYRVKGEEIDVLGTDVVIGGDIPPYKVTTVELEISLDKYQKYLVIHEQLAGKLAAGTQEGKGEGTSTEEVINIAAHRLLGYTYMHPGLDKFCKNKKTTTAKVVT